MSHGESLNGYSSVVIVDRKFGEKGKIQTTILVVRLKMSEKRKLVEYLHFPLQTMFLLSIALGRRMRAGEGTFRRRGLPRVQCPVVVGALHPRISQHLNRRLTRSAN